MSRLPALATYSAASSDSCSVMPKPRLRRIGKSRWLPTVFRSSKFCVLRVPICSMTPVGSPVTCSACADLVQVLVVGDLHRDHADVVLAGQLEDVGQALPAVALERVRARARLVGAHARAGLAGLLERGEGLLHVFARVHGVEARHDVEGVLVEHDALVLEADGFLVAGAAAEDPEFVGLGHVGSYASKSLWNTPMTREMMRAITAG